MRGAFDGYSLHKYIPKSEFINGPRRSEARGNHIAEREKMRRAATANLFNPAEREEREREIIVGSKSANTL